MNVYRYLEQQRLGTSLDPFSDVLEWLDYLTSEEYLRDILLKRHFFSITQAKVRSKYIIPHIKDAILFVQQSISGPNGVSFLPAYYAILNLAKVYILLGPRFSDLPSNRWHGATYDVQAKDSQSIVTEEICLKQGGALALFYETLTGLPMIKERVVRMGTIYSCVQDISAEYYLAAGRNAELGTLYFNAIPQKKGFKVQVKLSPRNSDDKISIKRLPCFKTFKKVPGKDNTFTSPLIQCSETELVKKLQDHLNSHLLYFSNTGNPSVAFCSRAFPMPEEFPIALLFFHMSSVVRYKPEFLSRVQQSRWWPVLVAARRHSLFKFMLLFWSYMHNEQFIITQV